ncbi:cytochrome P450 [Streptomyces sp. NPDC056690]|uniref:cytochrome P450 n=1 Tax=unclassified Streptomyces TaxID=2593676 RepID=UPI00363A7BE1
MTTPLKDLVQVEDPDFYSDGQFEVYDRMREEAPAFHYEPLNVYLLTRMDDVRHVSTHPELFSNTGGLTLNQLRMAHDGALAAFERFNEPDGELVITKDPPRQKQLRGLMAPTLAPRYLDGFQEVLDRFCRELVDEVAPGEPFDFVEQIAARLPLYVAAAILGVTEVDIPRMVSWVTALEDLTRVESVADLEGPGQRFDELKDFLRAQIAAKRENPGTDMISMFFRSRLDGADVPDAVVLAHVSTLMSNGGTTRLLLSSMAGYLADHPGEAKAMRGDPARPDAAMEEVLRLSPPARGFVRTLTADTTVADTELKAGDRVYMIYPAANRDPAHFTEPDRFDPVRERANHASFGFGTHFCLGSGLARMEVRALFSHLLDRFGEVRRTGRATRYPHVQLNGPATLPVSLHH